MGVTRCHLKGIFSAAAAQRQIVLHGNVCARQQPVCQEARRREKAPPHCSRRDATRPLGAAQVVTDVNPSVLSRMFLPTQIFHCHLASHRCGAQVQYQVNGLTYVLLSSPRTLVNDGKYVSMQLEMSSLSVDSQVVAIQWNSISLQSSNLQCSTAFSLAIWSSPPPVRAFSRYTRRRLERTHGGVLNLHTEGFSACQAAPQHTKQHNTTVTPHIPHHTTQCTFDNRP